MEKRARIVIVGGGFAGVLVAARLGRRRLDVTLVDPSEAFVERVRLHEIAAGREVRRHPYRALLPRRVAFLRGEVTRIDLSRRSVDVKTERGVEERAYDRLVYAPGSRVEIDRVPGVRAHAVAVTSDVAAKEMAARIASLPPGARLVVCGGGLTGVELATEIAERFPSLRVSLVTAGKFGEAFSPAGQRHLRAALARLAIDLVESSLVAAVEAGRLVLADGPPRAFDLCVWAGSFSVPSLARASGLAVSDRGQVLLDPFLRSISNPEVYAPGDAGVPAAADRIAIRMGCATAMPMAAWVAHNLAADLAGRAPSPFRFSYFSIFASLGRRDALAQYVRPDDTPLPFVSTGRIAALLKELTFRANLFALKTGFAPYRLLFSLTRAPSLTAPARPRALEAGAK